MKVFSGREKADLKPEDAALNSGRPYLLWQQVCPSSKTPRGKKTAENKAKFNVSFTLTTLGKRDRLRHHMDPCRLHGLVRGGGAVCGDSNSSQ